MNCDKVREHFDSLTDPEAPFRDSKVLDHILECSDCQQELKKWEKIFHAFKHAGKPSPPEGLVEEILSAVKTAGPTGPPPNPLSNRITGFRFRAAYALAAMLVMSFGLWMVTRQQVPQKEPVLEPVTQSPERPMLEVSLLLPAAESVAIVGDFNGWDKTMHPLARGREGRWRISLEMESGYYQYQLLVDGKEWMLDPGNSIVIADGFGGHNSGIYL